MFLAVRCETHSLTYEVGSYTEVSRVLSEVYEGDTILLTDDIQVEYMLTIQTSFITIDGQGHALIGTKSVRWATTTTACSPWLARLGQTRIRLPKQVGRVAFHRASEMV